MLYLLYSPLACSLHRQYKYTQLFFVWAPSRAISEFNNMHFDDLTLGNGEFYQGSLIMESMHPRSPWVYVESTKTGVFLDFE